MEINALSSDISLQLNYNNTYYDSSSTYINTHMYLQQDDYCLILFGYISNLNKYLDTAGYLFFPWFRADTNRALRPLVYEGKYINDWSKVTLDLH